MPKREIIMFKDVIGDIPESRILDFLLLHPHTGHTLAKIIDGTSLNFRTAQRRIENLVNLGVVEVTHEDRKSRYYIINTEHLLNEFEKISELWRKY
jgi:predicted transcriptional regulator